MATPTLYIVSDGKPGHLAQSRGLASAIKRVVPARVMEIDAEANRSAPQPEQGAGLILAAGHRTHSMALSLRKYLGVPAIAIMNPGWIGRQRFDLSIIPKHDRVRPSASVIVTEGALNEMTLATDASLEEGLVLIGGPSSHHRWDEQRIKDQLVAIIERDQAVRWTATSSRRTTEGTQKTLQALAKQYGYRLEYTPASQTPTGWVTEQLHRCGVCWVSEDSVSMIYEALTAGAQVGLLSVPQAGSPGRVTRGAGSLVTRGWVSTFDQWWENGHLPSDRPQLAEADRIAALLIERWLVS